MSNPESPNIAKTAHCTQSAHDVRHLDARNATRSDEDHPEQPIMVLGPVVSGDERVPRLLRWAGVARRGMHRGSQLTIAREDIRGSAARRRRKSW